MRSVDGTTRSQLLSPRKSSCSSLVEDDEQSIDSATTRTAVPAHKVAACSSTTSPASSSANESLQYRNMIKYRFVPTKAAFPPMAESSHIRSRYLRRLGVGNPKIAPMTQAQNISRNEQHSLEVLKNDHGRKDASLTTNSPPIHAHPILSKAEVSFESAVRVHCIPNRKEYSERVKKTLWMQPRELEESATRNYIEFQAEGWDWRRATEETDFVVYQNQLIHPAHLTRQCNLQQQFLMIMSAQQQHKQRR